MIKQQNAIDKMDCTIGNFEQIYNKFMGIFIDEILLEEKLGDTIRRTTYRDMDDYIRKVANNISYTLRDIEKGAWVGLKAQNSAAYLGVFWGTLMAGYNVVLLDARMDAKVTDIIMKNAGANIMICYDQDGAVPENIQRISFAGVTDIAYVNVITKPTWAEHIALCTSGTTDTSKVYSYSGRQFISLFKNVDYVNKNNEEMLVGQEKAIIILPFNHVFGLMTTMWFMAMGFTIIFPENITLTCIFKTCREYGVTWMIAVPMFWNGAVKKIAAILECEGEEAKKNFQINIDQSLESQKINWRSAMHTAKEQVFVSYVNQIFGASLKVCISGGSPLPKETLRILNGMGYMAMNGYGSTETGINSITIDREVMNRMSDSCGRSLTSAEYKIQLDNSGASESRGELLIRTSTLHEACLVNGKLQSPIIDVNGWYHSGDIAEIIEGYCVLVGRKKTVIIGESGENVYPEEIETYFEYLPYCTAVYVVGICDEKKNEHLTLILLPVGELTEEQVDTIKLKFNEMNNALVSYKRVEKVYILKDAVLTGGKVRKKYMQNEIANNSEKYMILDVTNVSCETVSDHGPNYINKGEYAIILENEEQYTEIVNKIKTIIVDIVNDEVDFEGLKPDQNIAIHLGINSLNMMEIMVDIEEEFKIKILPEDYPKFITLNSITCEILRQKLGVNCYC